MFAGRSLAGWWRARRDISHAFAIAVLAPLATAVAYVCSELLKSGFAQERPCRAVTDAAASLAACPPHGDWSFPATTPRSRALRPSHWCWPGVRWSW
ncbi:hypothetical protein [Streptomyces poriticola]|uniref:hypothetical protein n=1 Tax=Streptomyces poriticola TaxID=3120506 RepID=UPI002FCE2CFC